MSAAGNAKVLINKFLYNYLEKIVNFCKLTSILQSFVNKINDAPNCRLVLLGYLKLKPSRVKIHDGGQLNLLFRNILIYAARALVVLALSIPAILLLSPIQTYPSLEATESLASHEIARVEQLLLDLAPQSPTTLSAQEMILDISDLNILSRYMLDLMDLSARWTLNLSLDEKSLIASSSWRLTAGWIPLYLNMRSEFDTQSDQLDLINLQVGELNLPKSWTITLIKAMRANFIATRSPLQVNKDVLSNIRSISIEGSAIKVLMTWDPSTIGAISDQAQQFLISSEDRSRIVNYYQLINEIVTVIPTDTRAISLNTLLKPLFTSALEKSKLGSDPISENRALFHALAIYVNNEEIEKLIGDDLEENLPRPRFIEVRLLRRQDLAQHLVSMAAITASLGFELAQLVSTTKEAYDARYRSGFSFSDLTANNVGMTMANLATNNVNSALEIQRRLAGVEFEEDYMPLVGNNRDGIPEEDFAIIYNDRTSPEYQNRVIEIKDVIHSRPLFENL